MRGRLGKGMCRLRRGLGEGWRKVEKREWRIVNGMGGGGGEVGKVLLPM